MSSRADTGAEAETGSVAAGGRGGASHTASVASVMSAPVSWALPPGGPAAPSAKAAPGADGPVRSWKPGGLGPGGKDAGLRGMAGGGSQGARGCPGPLFRAASHAPRGSPPRCGGSAETGGNAGAGEDTGGAGDAGGAVSYHSSNAPEVPKASPATGSRPNTAPLPSRSGCASAFAASTVPDAEANRSSRESPAAVGPVSSVESSYNCPHQSSS